MAKRIQTAQDSEQPEKRVAALLIRLYAYLLRVYPADFQAAFADEMLEVFAMTLRGSGGHLALMLTMCREVLDFPLNLIAAYRAAHNQLAAPARRREQTRWFVRIIGGLLGLFLLSTLRVILSPSYNLYAQAVPFVVALFIASVSLLLGLRWGRIGGLLTIASGAAIGCCMTLYVYVMGLAEVGIIGTVFIGLVWALPFLIFGVLFYELMDNLIRRQTIVGMRRASSARNYS